MSLNTTPRTWVTGEVVTAAEFNTEVRDAFNGIQAAWTTYTAAWTATTTNPTIGNGSIDAAYMRIGKTIHFRIAVTAGSTSTFGSGAYSLGLPVAAGGTGRYLMAGTARDDSASVDYQMTGIVAASTGTVSLRCDSTTAGNPMAQVSGTTPFTLAVNDVLTIAGTYEAA